MQFIKQVILNPQPDHSRLEGLTQLQPKTPMRRNLCARNGYIESKCFLHSSESMSLQVGSMETCELEFTMNDRISTEVHKGE